jgi:imidazole glycerol phosphate synthase glutamine amidotransferase subunit
MKIALVDYGAGNLPSIERALLRLDIRSERANCEARISAAPAIILPGVGHYSTLIRALNANGLRESLLSAIAKGVPFLGICLGLQALYESSEEAPDLHGLHLLPGRVRTLPPIVKLPHMGWNQLRSNGDSRLLQGIDAAAFFYFAHSYAAIGKGPEMRATCTYSTEFVAVAEKENIYGVQFHPEKSGESGSRVLQNFVRIAA